MPTYQAPMTSTSNPAATTKIVVNYKNNAEAWWDELHRRAAEDESFPIALVDLASFADETDPLEPHEVNEVLDYCKALPGWDCDGENTPLLCVNARA